MIIMHKSAERKKSRNGERELHKLNTQERSAKQNQKIYLKSKKIKLNRKEIYREEGGRDGESQRKEYSKIEKNKVREKGIK